jgi:hypothetical protein
VSTAVTPIPSVHSCIIPVGTSAATMLRSFSHNKNDAITTMTIIIIIIIILRIIIITTENCHIGHGTHSSESADVKVH